MSHSSYIVGAINIQKSDQPSFQLQPFNGKREIMMSGYTQQFEKMASAQKEFLEPMKKMNEFAVDAFEKMTRHNYQVAGDFVDFSVEQARAVAAVDGVAGLFEQQVAAAQSFADLIGKRTGEYSVMTRDIFTEGQDVVKTSIVEPAQRVGDKYSEVAKGFQDDMKESFQAAGAVVKSASPKPKATAK